MLGSSHDSSCVVEQNAWLGTITVSKSFVPTVPVLRMENTVLQTASKFPVYYLFIISIFSNCHYDGVRDVHLGYIG